MVQRCSNGVAFLVLEPEPSVRTGIRVDIFEGDNPLSLIARLPLTWGRRWTDPLKGTGSGEFWIHADDETLAANPGLLAYGNIARFSLDESYRFAIQIEHLDRVQVEADGDVSRTIKVSGRGVLSKLEEAVLYPDGGLAGNPIRTFTDANADDLLGVAFDEAQTRGALAGLTRDFTASADSNNAPYDVTLTVEERAGVSVLRIGERLGELAGDLYMTPAGVLKFVNQRGVDRSQQLPNAGPVILRPADNLEELTRSEDGQVRNLLLIETPGGFLERTEGGSVSTYGRREAFLSLGNISDGDAIDRAASSVFASSADPAAEIGTRVLDKDGVRPYVDWGVGDWVLAPDEDGELERHRVRALTVSEDDEGEPQFVPELATITEELETRLERWLAAMEKGTVGGTAAGVAEPVKAPVEVVDAIDAGLGDHLAAQPHHDELADLVDTDLTGVQTNDLLEYDGADWVPVDPTEALAGLLDLDELADVNVPGAGVGDMVYQNDSGLWVVVTGTKDDGDVPTIQADGSVAWEAPPAGGGGGGGSPPPTSGWSWVNQGSAVVASIGDAIAVQSPAVGANNLIARVRSAPSTPYSIYARAVGATTSGNGGFGVCFRESATGKLTVVYIKRGGGLVGENWTNPTTFAGGVFSTAMYDAVPLWLRLEDDGTTLTYYAGFLGGAAGVVQLGTQARTAFMAGGPDQVGFVGRDNSQPLSFGLVEWLES